jgi:MinD-like ATPase involved in chromosome partitioning or flagellar assembly
VALLDLDQAWPSVAQRLSLPVHPNLRTAVDSFLHEPDRLAQTFHFSTGFDVVTGLANPEAGALPPADLAGLVGELNVMYRRVVVDVGSTGNGVADLLLKHVDAILVVGLADPVGLTRLIRAFRRVDGILGERDVGVIVNRVRSSTERAEAISQLRRSLGAVPIFAIPDDSRVARAARDGTLLGRGPYFRSVRRLAGLFSEVGPG